ncbi:MAG: hypothetical protein N3D73_01165 [Candidatus Diapherotrites archaeon]|nr:hypothetical protein [Candidatus Diapherotrites archaeon]
MRKIFFLFILFISFVIFSHSVILEKLEIEVEVNKEGYATVKETYKISFTNSYDEYNFNQIKTKNGSSLTMWSLDYNWLSPKFGNLAGQEMPISKSNMTFEEKENKIIVNYELSKPIAFIMENKPRVSNWRIYDSFFQKFIKNDLINIPQNTVVNIILPKEAYIDKDILTKQAVVNENIITLTGISTNYINIRYEIKKPIGSSNSMIENFLRNTTIGNLIIILSLITLLLIFVFRKRIKEKIENYIVEHTEFEIKEIEEEVEA